MKTTPSKFSLCCGGFCFTLFSAAAPLQAIDLTESTFTQVVHEVTVSDQTGKKSHPAIIQTEFKAPDVITTGPDSRAELTAPDQTVTRVGCNTVFSFMPVGRGINLEQGSVLFNSPHGKGGGKVQTRSATASVLGTTIIVSATQNGGFKLLVVEGHGKVTLPNGVSQLVNAGQLTFVLPGSTKLSPVFNFRLSKQINNSMLLQGFQNKLPADVKITAAENYQENQIAKGNLKDTGLILGNVVGNDEVQLINGNSRQVVVNNSNPGVLDSGGANYVLENITISNPFLDSKHIVKLNLGIMNSLAQFQANLAADPNLLDFFLANNLTISSSNIHLTPYALNDGFLFFAVADLNVTGSTSFDHSPGLLGLFATNHLNITPGSELDFNNARAFLAAGRDINFSSVNLYNFGGQLALYSDGAITLHGGGLLSGTSPGGDGIVLISQGNFSGNGTNFTCIGSGTNGLQISAQGSVSLTNDTYYGPNSDMTVSGSSITVQGGNYVGKNLTLNALAGTLSLSNGNFIASGNLNASSSGNMQVQNSTFNVGGNVSLTGGSNATLTASNLNINNAISVAMQAGTLVLNNVSFPSGSVVRLYSSLGSTGGNLPNFGSVQTGRVNFAGSSPSSITYGGIPIGDLGSYSTFNSNGANSGKVNILTAH